MVRGIWKAGVLVGLAAGPALGQGSNVPAGAQRVDPGFGDVGALQGVSRVDLRKDLRQERGFGSVYRLELPRPMGGPGATSTVFFRVDAGLTAVFPAGVYTSGRVGGIPEVPPGTRYYIGPLPASVIGTPPRAPLPPNYVDLSTSLRAAPEAVHYAPVAPRRLERSIWEDEDVRRQTIGALLDSAAGRPG